VPFRVIEKLRPLRRHPWLGYAAGLAVFGLAFLLRFAAGGLLDDVPFITLFPAILIAALLGGLQVGIVVAILSLVAAWNFFIPPRSSWQIGTLAGLVTLLLFCITAGIQLFVIETLNRTVDRLSDERDRVAILFRELQHRVANNMAFVASLLRLKRRTLDIAPQDAAAVLDDADKRLETIARIHRRLYDPAIIDMPLDSYLDGFVRDILEASGAKNIVCIIEVPPVKFDLERLVTLSLLVNEVITNSLKHGFDGREAGIISIKLEREAHAYVLAIKDNGRGLYADSDPAASPTLGMTIIHSLAAQLGGKIAFSNAAGTTARLSFPADH
jgi:two-component sensor histidine kinase